MCGYRKLMNTIISDSRIPAVTQVKKRIKSRNNYLSHSYKASHSNYFIHIDLKEVSTTSINTNNLNMAAVFSSLQANFWLMIHTLYITIISDQPTL